MRTTGWTRERRQRFLDVLAASANVALAARAVGVNGASAWALRKRDHAFAELFAEAMAQGYDALEGALLERARGGVNAIEVEGLPLTLTGDAEDRRLGERPRMLVTTTPRPTALMRRVMALDGLVQTLGRTRDNPHLPASFVGAMIADYGGTRLGRQELDGELVEDLAGALWTRALIEGCRVRAAPALVRVVVGVDPPAGTDGDACGIVAVGLDYGHGRGPTDRRRRRASGGCTPAGDRRPGRRRHRRRRGARGGRPDHRGDDGSRAGRAELMLRSCNSPRLCFACVETKPNVVSLRCP